jgi:hypothetical protein
MEDEDVLLWLERACYLSIRTPQPRHFALVDGNKWKEQKRKLYASRYSMQIVDARWRANIRISYGFWTISAAPGKDSAVAGEGPLPARA